MQRESFKETTLGRRYFGCEQLNFSFQDLRRDVVYTYLMLYNRTEGQFNVLLFVVNMPNLDIKFESV